MENTIHNNPGHRRIRWRHVIWQLLLACCALGAVRYWHERREPECFPNAKTGQGIFIYNGQQFWVSPSDKGDKILSQPIFGRQAHLIVGEDSHYQILTGWSPSNPLMFANNSILYTVVPRTKFAGGAVGRGRPDRSRYIGIYISALKKPTPQQLAQEKRIVLSHSANNQVSPTLLHRIFLRGGAPGVIFRYPDGVVVGDTIYWINVRPDEGVQITSGHIWWKEVTGHSELMATSLIDGSSHMLHTDLLQNTQLMAGQQGVFWREPRPFPDSRWNLLYYSKDDTITYKILDYRGDPNGLPPVELGGRLYWFVCDGPYDARLGNPWKADRLVSANLNGSNPHMVFSLTGKKLTPISWREEIPQYLQVYKGNLYCLLRENTSEHNLDEKPLNLCRIYPGRSEPIQVVYSLPKQSMDCQFDGDYFYFTHLEKRQSLVDYLFNQGNVDIISNLCRVRIPE